MKTLPAVIVLAESQRDRVEKLVAYCKKLDGTIINVLEAPEATRLPYPKCNDAAFHAAAATYRGKPFLWMEPDSIPLKPNWVRDISDEYFAAGKEFMLSSDSNPPHDLVGGIGVYGPNTHWLIPKTFQKGAWDLWMFNHAKAITHSSALIQHSYGKYFQRQVEPHRFPKDGAIIRKDAVIFHRDRYQDLITPAESVAERKEVVLKHNGDLGDILAALPILREMGGGKIVLFHDPDVTKGKCPRESLKGARFEAIKPLLEAQPYVTGVEWGEGIDTQSFREVLRPRHESLTERQARHINRWPIDLSPWLTVPNFEEHKRIICSRSPRYHSPYNFPWKEAYQTYGERLLFVGLPEEHKAFEYVIGGPIERAETKDFLEIAQLMAGAPQVIANQSSPLWVAIGLGCKIICEGSSLYPNSELPRPGSFWAYEPEHMDIVRAAFEKVRRK